MSEPRAMENPVVELVESDKGETTLWIDGAQAMQGWERDLMWESADLLCTYGSEFLEVGLGLGLSALRIAGNPRTRRHTVVEKYQQVIDLFHARNPAPPAALEIVHADFFDHVYALAPASLDGIFFDPYLVSEAIWSDAALWDEVLPLVKRALRPGGAFIPCFTTQPVLRWPFYYFFERVVVERRTYTTYEETQYTTEQTGDAYVECFIKTK